MAYEIIYQLVIISGIQNKIVNFKKKTVSYRRSAQSESVDAGAEVLLQGKLSRGIIFNVMGRRLLKE